MSDTRDEYYNRIMTLALSQRRLEIPCPDEKTVTSLRANLYSYGQRCRKGNREQGEGYEEILAAFDQLSLYKRGTTLLISEKEKEEGLLAMKAVLAAHGAENLPEAMTEEEQESLKAVEQLLGGD